MQHDVYDYTNPAMGIQRNSVLRKTYGLLAVSFIPCALGAFAAAATGFNLFSLTGNRWAGHHRLLRLLLRYGFPD